MAKWTREKIIREILRREAAGLPLSLGSSKDGVESKLYKAGSRVFGSWDNAVKAAGIAPERAKVHHHWSPSRILARIRSLSRRQQPLRPGELKRRHDHLMQAARRFFGSWSKAVVAAGVDPDRLKRVMPWTEERIIEAILTRALHGKPLNSHAVQPKSLVEAGARVFGSWALALAAAGIDPNQVSGRHHGVGFDSNGGSTIQHEQRGARGRPGMHGTVASRMPDTACSELGGDRRNPVRRWSEKVIIQAILARLHEHRKINAVAVLQADKPLYRAARRQYGNWRNALLAAGLNPDEFCARPATSPVPTSRPVRRRS